MATQDNNLGAPSEGFGQTVTFAFHPDGGGVPRLGGENPVQLRAGVQGDPSVGDGRTMSPGVQLPKSDPTMAALLKIGGGVIAPYIKQHQQEKFIEGMQRAMAGEAVQDIAKSEPWYANLFGNSDVVEGARAYKASAAVSDVIGQMEADMPNLRKMGSQDATSYFNQRVQNGLTGDASTDMHIMRAVQQQLPSLMKRQAKEHYGWQQEEASKAESDARWKAAKSLQEGAVGLANGTITNDEFLGRQGAFAQLLLPAAGRDIVIEVPESYLTDERFALPGVEGLAIQRLITLAHHAASLKVIWHTSAARRLLEAPAVNPLAELADPPPTDQEYM